MFNLLLLYIIDQGILGNKRINLLGAFLDIFMNTSDFM